MACLRSVAQYGIPSYDGKSFAELCRSGNWNLYELHWGLLEQSEEEYSTTLVVWSWSVATENRWITMARSSSSENILSGIWRNAPPYVCQLVLSLTIYCDIAVNAPPRCIYAEVQCLHDVTPYWCVMMRRCRYFLLFQQFIDFNEIPHLNVSTWSSSITTCSFR